MLLRYSVEIKSIIDQGKRAPAPTKTVVTPNVAVDLDKAWASPWYPPGGLQRAQRHHRRERISHFVRCRILSERLRKGYGRKGASV